LLLLKCNSILWYYHEFNYTDCFLSFIYLLFAQQNAISIDILTVLHLSLLQHLKDGIDQLTPNAAIELYFKNFTLVCMPSACSRHNAPMLPHALSKLVKPNLQMAPKQYIVVSRGCLFSHSILSCVGQTLSVPRTSLYNFNGKNFARVGGWDPG